MSTVKNGTRISIVCLLAIRVLIPAVFPNESQRSSGFEQILKPFLKHNCIRCHGEEKQKGKLTLHKASYDFSKVETSELWVKILEQLTAGDMPPPTKKTNLALPNVTQSSNLSTSKYSWQALVKLTEKSSSLRNTATG